MNVSQVGAKIGGFEILCPLGANEGSRVFAAQGEDDVEVALKCLGKTGLCSADAPEILSGLQEVTHSNLAAVVGLTIWGGKCFVASQHIEGLDVQHTVLKSGALRYEDAIKLGHALAGALGVLRAAGITHGNVKPSSVILTAQNQPTLVEWGEPKQVLDFLHLAPEQVEGEPSSYATDLYGLGSTLYFGLTGALAFPWGEGVGRAEYLASRVAQPASPLVGDDIPERLTALLLRLLAREPVDRLPAREVQGELAALGARVGLDLRDQTQQTPPRVVVLLDQNKESSVRVALGGSDLPPVAPKQATPRDVVRPAAAAGATKPSKEFASADRTMLESVDLPGEGSADRTMLQSVDLPSAGSNDYSADRTMLESVDLPGAGSNDYSADRTMLESVDLPDEGSADRTMLQSVDLPSAASDEGDADQTIIDGTILPLGPLAAQPVSSASEQIDRTAIEETVLPLGQRTPAPVADSQKSGLADMTILDLLDVPEADVVVPASQSRPPSQTRSASRTGEADELTFLPGSRGPDPVRQADGDDGGVFEIDLGGLDDQVEGELTEVGGFQIISLLGEGGMGQVYKAWQKSLDREVAIKVLTSRLHGNKAFVESLEQEAKAAAKLHHANIVGVIEQGTCKVTGRKFVAFEFVDGETAGAMLKRLGQLPERDALTICLAIAEALTCAEEHGIVHRDVKPENVLIGRDGIPKLADLGLAKKVETSVDADQRFQGTPRYAAPEQITGEHPVDVRADLYAVGLCLYEFVVGSPAYGGKSYQEVISRKLKRGVPDPRVVRPQVSAGLARLIGWLCERDPGDRYATARAAAKSIRSTMDTGEPLDPSIAEVIASAGGLRASPAALAPADPTIADEAPYAEEDDPYAEEDNPYAEAPPKAGTKRFTGRGYYDDVKLNMMEPDSEPDSPYSDSSDSSDSDPGSGPDSTAGVSATRADATRSGSRSRHTPAPPPLPSWGKTKEKEEPKEEQAVRLGGASLYDDDELLAQLGPDKVTETREVSKDEDAAPTMVLSGDMSRAYQFGTARGQVGAGKIYDVTIQGDGEFAGFERPVTRGSIKVCFGKTALRREQRFYATPDPGYPHMIDKGLINDVNRYLVFEPLEAHPAQRLVESGSGGRIDPALAVDTYLNLFASLLRFHKLPDGGAFLLCGIEPQSIRLRMPSSDEDGLSDAEYLERLVEGRWTPIFTDLSQAQRLNLLAGCRRVERSAVFLAPEALPSAGERGVVTGTYSPKSDVYALSLVFYSHLTGDRPYEREGIYELEPREAFRQLMNLKDRGVSPISDGKLLEVGTGARMLVKLLRAATDADPAKRPNAQALFEKCCDVFGAKPGDQRSLEDYVYDDMKRGLALRQTYFPAFAGAPSSA
ncbi:MAG: protein kinase [Planctomycetes bacterium]|nr:protein kinase [Planctomycetota bacterium]